LPQGRFPDPCVPPSERRDFFRAICHNQKGLAPSAGTSQSTVSRAAVNTGCLFVSAKEAIATNPTGDAMVLAANPPRFGNKLYRQINAEHGSQPQEDNDEQ